MTTTLPDAGRTVHPLPPLAAHRQRLIAAELQRVGAVSTSELASRWGLSPSSITRDLTRLAAVGRCRRVRGGAVAGGHARSSASSAAPWAVTQG